MLSLEGPETGQLLPCGRKAESELGGRGRGGGRSLMFAARTHRRSPGRAALSLAHVAAFQSPAHQTVISDFPLTSFRQTPQKLVLCKSSRQLCFVRQ